MPIFLVREQRPACCPQSVRLRNTYSPTIGIRGYAAKRTKKSEVTDRENQMPRRREKVGREASPTASVIDSQSVKTTESGGPRAVYYENLAVRDFAVGKIDDLKSTLFKIQENVSDLQRYATPAPSAKVGAKLSGRRKLA
jgi:hypothetical protein